MNILVTGAGGFVGSDLAQRLVGPGQATVFSLIHDREPTDWGGEYLRGDVTDFPRMLEIIVNCEINQIYHLASKSIVRNCRCDPLGCFTTNVLGTATILEAARQSERIQGVMVMESDKSYGNGPVPYREDQALRPSGVYEASKACVAHLMSSYHKNYGLPVFSIRSANIYGPGDKNSSRLIPNTITRLLRGERPQITAGAEKFRREFIYIDDAISYMVALMAKQPWGETFNIGTGEIYTVADIVAWICDLMDADTPAVEWSKPATLLEITDQLLCLDKLHEWLPDFNLPPVPLRLGLERTIKWYRDRS